MMDPQVRKAMIVWLAKQAALHAYDEDEDDEHETPHPWLLGGGAGLAGVLGGVALSRYLNHLQAQNGAPPQKAKLRLPAPNGGLEPWVPAPARNFAFRPSIREHNAQVLGTHAGGFLRHLFGPPAQQG
jgi:hypothetical protein